MSPRNIREPKQTTFIKPAPPPYEPDGAPLSLEKPSGMLNSGRARIGPKRKKRVMLRLVYELLA